MLNTIRGNDFKFTVASSLSLLSLKNSRDVHYIGGAEVLPAPLEPHEEAIVIDELTKKQSEEAKKLLIERNLRLVVYIARKFDNTGVGIEDLISIGTIGLIKAINTFKNDKNIKLATYASRCIENELLMRLRQERKEAREVSLYEPIGTDKEGNEISLMDIISVDDENILQDIIVSDHINHISDIFFKVLDKREQIVLTLRYGLFHNDEMTQKDIAKKLNISRSYVSRIEKKALLKLRSALTS